MTVEMSWENVNAIRLDVLSHNNHMAHSCPPNWHSRCMCNIKFA